MIKERDVSLNCKSLKIIVLGINGLSTFEFLRSMLELKISKNVLLKKVYFWYLMYIFFTKITSIVTCCIKIILQHMLIF